MFACLFMRIVGNLVKQVRDCVFPILVSMAGKVRTKQGREQEDKPRNVK